MQRTQLKNLYELYGFKQEYVSETEGYIPFSYQAGMFYNIEIVCLKNDNKTKRDIEEKKKEYKSMGFDSVTYTEYHGMEKMHEHLFEAFFKPKFSKDRLQKEYEAFCNKQTEKLQQKYQYIMSSFQNSELPVSKDIVDYVISNKKDKQARLTIVEAAAGYGKTCTVYEILNRLVEQETMQIPLFIELSKNRNARLFRYVLQDEIDKKFTQLSSEVVIEEIKQGRLPLIIDGFDELIEQKNKIAEDADERSVSMLGTIAELLRDDSNAWILMTTRNSAIFSGDSFDEWVLSKLGKNCQVDRLRILKPSVKEWLGDDVYSVLLSNKIKIKEIANPVLLTFLKNCKAEQIKEHIKSQDSILEYYFELLLKRDRDRLDLLLDKEEQYDILVQLAASFAQYDITVDTIEFIQDLLRDILGDQLLELLSRYQQREDYADSDIFVQTDKEYIQKLSHSCLLDRTKISENRYGFINEFILGILTGDAVRKEYFSPSELSQKYLEIISTAYEGRTENIREELYGKLKDALGNASGMCRLSVECALLHDINTDYKEQYFQTMVFPEYIDFSGEHSFDECTFDNCSFQNCTINARVFNQCKFFKCQFYNVNVIGIPDANLLFMSCKGEDVLQLKEQVMIKADVKTDEYEKLVLEQFWKPGYQSAELRRSYTALFKGINPKEHYQIQDAIKKLMKENIIRELNVCYELNTDNMGKIKSILGRQ